MAELKLLLPSLARIQAAGTPTDLARWLARGNRLVEAKPGRDAVLRDCFQFIGTAMPTAALTRSLDSDDASSALWLRADPAYAMVDAVTARLLACGTLDLSHDESFELARAVQPLFGDAGFPLERATPTRWYLRCPPGARLPQFASPEDVLGDDLMRHLPQGENQRQWRHLLNESQIILHNHPLNAQRVQRGLMPANSLWFWGAGRLPDTVRSGFTRVFSNDDVAIALSRLAKLEAATPQPGEFARIDAKDRLLLDLADIADATALERDWLSPVDALLRRRSLKVLTLLFASGERVTVKPAHRWRFWRRVKTEPAQ